MSSVSAPYGLSFFEYKGGKNRGALNQYYVSAGNANAFGQGDPVQLGTATSAGAYVAYTPAGNAAASQTIGVFVSAEYVNTQGQTVITPYLPANTQTFNNQSILITVEDLPYNIYKIQCSGALAGISIGKNYNLVASGANPNNGGSYAPNALTGQSQAALAVNTYAAGNTWQTVKIVGLAPAIMGQTNAWSDPYPDVLVIINNHLYKPGTIGI